VSGGWLVCVVVVVRGRRFTYRDRQTPISMSACDVAQVVDINVDRA